MVRPSAVGVVVELSANLEPVFTCPAFVGDADGVVGRNGDETGDSGLLNGELRGEPYPRGDGL